MLMISEKMRVEYAILTSGFGFVQLSPRTLLKAAGADAAKFLHSFCTSDVSSMNNGDVGEAFVLDSRGKTLAFGHILRIRDSYLYSVAAKEISSQLLQHLDKYVIREDVELTDISDLHHSIFACGTESAAPLFDKFGVTKEVSQTFDEDGIGFTAAYADFAGSGFLITFESSQLTKITEELKQLKAVECSTESLEMVRLESGCPWYGREIDQSNLPQEIRRDETAISFTKGCYLGQETVAKIDAIGHVNRFLVGLKLGTDSSVSSGADVLFEGNKTGAIKTAAFSPELSSRIALAYVKRQHAEPGNELVVDDSVAKVIELPIKKP